MLTSRRVGGGGLPLVLALAAVCGVSHAFVPPSSPAAVASIQRQEQQQQQRGVAPAAEGTFGHLLDGCRHLDWKGLGVWLFCVECGARHPDRREEHTASSSSLPGPLFDPKPNNSNSVSPPPGFHCVVPPQHAAVGGAEPAAARGPGAGGAGRATGVRGHRCFLRGESGGGALSLLVKGWWCGIM